MNRPVLLVLAAAACAVVSLPGSVRSQEKSPPKAYSLDRIVEGDQHSRPTWSPDGGRIAFWSNLEKNHLGLNVCDADGGNRKELARVKAHRKRDSYTCFLTVWREPSFLWSADGKTIVYMSLDGRILTVGLARPSKGTSEILAEIECPRHQIPHRYALAPDGGGVVVRFLFARHDKGKPFVMEKPYEDGRALLMVTKKGKILWSPDPWKAVVSSPKRKLLAAACPTGLWLLDSKLKKKREIVRFPVLTFAAGMAFLDSERKILLPVRPDWRQKVMEFFLVDVATGAMERLGQSDRGPQHLVPLDKRGRRFLLVETVWEGPRLPGRDVRHPTSTRLFVLEKRRGEWGRTEIRVKGGVPFYIEKPYVTPDGRWIAFAGRHVGPKGYFGGLGYCAVGNRLLVLPVDTGREVTPGEFQDESMERYFLRNIAWHPAGERFLIVTTRAGFAYGPEYHFQKGLGNVDFQFRGEIRVCEAGKRGWSRVGPLPPPVAPESFENTVGMKFVLLPAGTFEMGTPADEIARLAAEQPDRARSFEQEKLHQVQITKPFYMAVFEVTNALYERYDPDSRRDPFSDGDDEPVSIITWPDAAAFCEWLTKNDPEGRVYRLPTEAEWEYAARGGLKGRTYPLGDALTVKDACFNARHTRKVGSFRANGFGLHDMAGNVAEWCADRYDEAYYSRSPARDPRGPAKGDQRVLRGGAWCSPGAVDCRTAARGWYGQGARTRLDYHGIRVVCEVRRRADDE